MSQLGVQHVYVRFRITEEPTKTSIRYPSPAHMPHGSYDPITPPTESYYKVHVAESRAGGATD